MRRPATLRSAFAVAALCAVSVFGQLNPTVKVLPKAQSPVPSECVEGLAPAQPRVIIAEAQPPQSNAAPAAAPPSLDLKTRLRAVQIAAEQNNRDAFKVALAEARSALASYPSGGERDTANDLISVYNDLERLWDFSFSSPTGAFFDASTDNGSLVNMIRRYPEYPRFIGEFTLNVGGQVIYPSRETRRFLTTEATKRLARLGVRTPTRITEAPPRMMPAPQPTTPRPTARPPTKPAARAEAHAPRKPAHKATGKPSHRRTPTKVAEANITPPQPRKTEPPPPAPAPVPVPAPLSPPTESTATVPPTATETTASTSPPPSTTTAPTATETPTASAAPAKATTSPQSQQQGGGRMNLLFAIILIVIGIGVLIVLFRASD